MTILYAETFTGPDANPIGGVWATVTGLQGMKRISNNMDGGAGDSASYVSTVPAIADQYVKLTLGSVTISTDGGPILRAATGTVTHYLLDLANPSQMYWVNGGAYTPIGASFAYTPTLGDVFEFDAVGTTLTAKVNGVTKATVVDTHLASGHFGVFDSGTSLRWSAFEGGDFGVAADDLMGQTMQ